MIPRDAALLDRAPEPEHHSHRSTCGSSLAPSPPQTVLLDVHVEFFWRYGISRDLVVLVRKAFVLANKSRERRFVQVPFNMFERLPDLLGGFRGSPGDPSTASNWRCWLTISPWDVTIWKFFKEFLASLRSDVG